MPKKITTLFCFSPAVMLATFLVETVACIYALIRWGEGLFGGLAVFLLLSLGIFQWSEYIICKGGDPFLWAKIGHVAITWLPVIGLQLVSMATYRTRFVRLAWGCGAFLSFGIIVSQGIFVAAVCTGRYVIFETQSFFDWTYGVYYLSLLCIALGMLFAALWQKKGDRTLLQWMMFGYLSFLVPTCTLSLLAMHVRGGVPSIMCGFALVMALTVVVCILPRYKAVISRQRKSKR